MIGHGVDGIALPGGVLDLGLGVCLKLCLMLFLWS
jgi:hypothetical protein